MAANRDASHFVLRGRKGLSPLVAAAGSPYDGVFQRQSRGIAERPE